MSNSIIFSNIENLLKESKMKKMDFYKAIEVTPEGFKWMKEKDTMKTNTLYKIAEVLKVSPEKLMSIPVEIPTDNLLSEPEEKILNANDVIWQMLKSLKSQVELIEKYLNQKTEIK